MTDPTIQLLRRLVAIDSVNPSLVEGGAGEGEIARAIAAALAAGGLAVETTEVRPGRPNVVGVLEGRRPGRSLMLCGHVDTVGVAGMERPFEPVERDGRLYGRGAVDMKGGVAAAVGAALALAAGGGLEAGRLIVAAVADEEYESLGAEALVGAMGADAAVVVEPTDLTVAVGHRGYSWAEVTIEGRAAHGSRPDLGRDAILRMGRFLARLEALGRALQALPPHPVMGAASLHASRIDGGRELSTYPDRCRLELERRTLPGEAADVAAREAEAILAVLVAEEPDLAGSVRHLFGRPAFETPAGHPLPGLLDAALAAAGRPARRGGVSFWTDAAILAGAGIPCVVFGPGGEGLHAAVELVRLDEVVACRDALVHLARAWTGA